MGMNILALAKDQAEKEAVVEYAQKVCTEDDHVILLHIVNVAGDIPTTKNGRVLEVCTEFDLSPYHQKKAENEAWVQNVSELPIIDHAEVIIGHRKAILKDHIEKKDIDLIITATEHSSESLDLIRKTKAGLIKNELNVPVLTFKCDRSKEEIKDIAIVSDFENPEAYDLKALKAIADRSDAKISLYSFSKDMHGEEELKTRMKAFSDTHGLEAPNFMVVAANDKKKTAQDLMMSFPLQLMVVLDIQRTGIKKILQGDLESDILNHTLIPILAY